MTTRRNAAYNPGSGGSVKGEASIKAIADKLFSRILPAMRTKLIENMASCLFHHSVADQSQSLNILQFMQTLVGDFVGYCYCYCYYYQLLLLLPLLLLLLLLLLQKRMLNKIS